MATPAEVQGFGMRPGTTVKINTATNEPTVVQQPVNPNSSTGAGGKPAKLSVQELSELSKARTELAAARGLIPLMDEFVKINEKADTGGAYTMVGPGLPGSETAARMLGGDPVQRMMTITSRMTPAMRQGLPGAASDRDVALFQDATVGIGKSRKVNAQIRDMTKAMIIRSGDFLAFKEAYARANNTLLGAQEKWDEYVDANPLFEQSGEGLPKLRKVVPWRNVIDTSMPDDGSAGGGAEDDVDALLEKYK